MNNLKKIFFIFFITLLFTSCVSASLLIVYASHNDKLVSSDDYIKKNIIISFNKDFTMTNLDNGKIKYVSTDIWQGRSRYSFEEVSRMIANTLAKEGFNNIFLYIELMDYEREKKSSNNSYSRSGRAGPFDAFQAGTNAGSSIMDSIEGDNMYIIKYIVFDIIK